VPKTTVQMNKALADYRKSLGLVLVNLWRPPKHAAELKKKYPNPVLPKGEE